MSFNDLLIIAVSYINSDHNWILKPPQNQQIILLHFENPQIGRYYLHIFISIIILLERLVGRHTKQPLTLFFFFFLEFFNLVSSRYPFSALIWKQSNSCVLTGVSNPLAVDAIITSLRHHHRYIIRSSVYSHSDRRPDNALQHQSTVSTGLTPSIWITYRKN